MICNQWQGWGMSGQLGHGDELGRQKPAVVHDLQPYRVAQIGCGLSHTVCTNAKGHGCMMLPRIASRILSDINVLESHDEDDLAAELNRYGRFRRWHLHLHNDQSSHGVPMTTASLATAGACACTKGAEPSREHHRDGDGGAGSTLAVRSGGGLPAPFVRCKARYSPRHPCVARHGKVPAAASSVLRPIAVSAMWCGLCLLASAPQEIRGVACGSAFTLVTTVDGKVFAFGSGEDGQLGLGPSIKARWSPEQIFALSGVVMVTACGSHSLAVTGQGHLYSWCVSQCHVVHDTSRDARWHIPLKCQQPVHQIMMLSDLMRHDFCRGLNRTGQLGA